MKKSLTWGLGTLLILLAVLVVTSELRLRDLRDEVASLRGERHDVAAKPPAPAPTTDAVKGSLSDMDGEIVALRRDLERLTREVAAMKAAQPVGPADAPPPPKSPSRIEQRVRETKAGFDDWNTLRKKWHPLKKSEETPSEEYLETILRETETFLGLTVNQKVDFRQATREFLPEAARQRDVRREYSQKEKELHNKHPDGLLNDEYKKEYNALREWYDKEASSWGFGWQNRMKVIGDRLAPLLDETNPRHKTFRSDLKDWVLLF